MPNTDEVDTATAGLLGSGLSKDVVLDIIKDEEDSCQDSDFSGDEEKQEKQQVVVPLGTDQKPDILPVP